MKKNLNNGICTYCKTGIPKNSRSIIDHFEKCDERTITGAKASNYFILVLEDPYAPQYWLVIKAKPNLPLRKLDVFIREIWVDCCGHLSEFSDKNATIPMSQELSQVFDTGVKINYVYDFGTSTEITISMLQEIKDIDVKDIQVLARNKEIEYQCSHCKNKAVLICSLCADEDDGLLCESCINKHKCVQEEGEEVLSSIENSPRMGVCGYMGYSEKKVKKYFPKDVI